MDLELRHDVMEEDDDGHPERGLLSTLIIWLFHNTAALVKCPHPTVHVHNNNVD
jgi:hypothetical protein